MHVRPIDPKTATMRVTFHLEDPQGLGQSQPTLSVPANPGMSLLEVAMANGINIEHACGGVCACSTCHVYLEKGEGVINEPSEAELDRVEEAPGLQRNSRLSCQCTLQQTGGSVEVRVPAWNRNAVKEDPH